MHPRMRSCSAYMRSATPLSNSGVTRSPGLAKRSQNSHRPKTSSHAQETTWTWMRET